MSHCSGRFAVWQWYVYTQKWSLMVSDVSSYSTALSIGTRIRNKEFPCFAIEKPRSGQSTRLHICRTQTNSPQPH
jgi:hypothetical protein